MMRAIATIVLLIQPWTSFAQAPTPAPRWENIDQSSALTGARTTGGALDSRNMLANTLGYEARASLIIRCGGERGLAFS